MINFIKAARPQTLVAAICPILCTYFFAVSEFATKDTSLIYIFRTLQCLVIAFCLQISTNYFNDYYDWLKGADDNRVGPARYSSNDTVRNKLFKAGIVLLILAFVFMIPLFFIHWAYIPLGLSSLYFSYGYTGGLYPLAYNRMGELFVFLYFGVLIVLGTFHVLTQQLPFEIIKLSFLFGFVNTIIIALNNFRDLEGDILVGKRTLAGFLGENYFKFFLIALLFSQAICEFSFLSSILFYISLCLKFSLVFQILKVKKAEQRASVFKFGILNMILSTVLVVWGFI